MKKRQIFSPYYDFKCFQYKNPYLKSPRKSPHSKELTSRGQKIATAEEKNVYSRTGRSQSSEKIPRSLSLEAFDEKGFGDAAVSEKQHESLEDFSKYQTLNSTNRSCQTVEVKMKRSPGPKRVSSQTFSVLNQQLMNKK